MQTNGSCTAAAQTKKIIQFKKPQFLSAPEMKNVIEKCKEAGNSQMYLMRKRKLFWLQQPCC